jgi:hypothetical protein
VSSASKIRFQPLPELKIDMLHVHDQNEIVRAFGATPTLFRFPYQLEVNADGHRVIHWQRPAAGSAGRILGTRGSDYELGDD